MLAVTLLMGTSLFVSAASSPTILYVDFTKSYEMAKDSGATTLRHNPKNLFLSVRASTDLSVANDQRGYASVTLRAVNGEQTSSYSSEVVNNVINSGKATVSGQSYAKEVWHYAQRYSDNKEFWYECH